MKKYWFYLESYTFIWTKNNKGVVYNSLLYSSIEFNNVGIVKEKITQFDDLRNMYCIELTEEELLDNNLKKLVSQLQDSSSGGLMEKSLSDQKPVIFPPKLKLFRSAEQNGVNPRYEEFGKEMKTYLHEITFFVNGSCNHQCAHCDKQYKQMLYCTKSNYTLAFDVVYSYLAEFETANVSQINLLGGNIFDYKEIYKLSDLINRIKSAKTTFHSNYLNVPNDFSQLNIFKKENLSLKILVNFPITDKFEKTVLLVNNSELNIEWLFAITSEDECDKVINLVEKYQLKSFEIKPLFTGSNYTFFKENVFLSKKDILKSKLNRRQIFMNEVLNIFDFGKIVITSDGLVYANLNHSSLGDIKNPILELMYKELGNGTSWRRTRCNTTPCKNCVYSYLCPSPSNYELVIKQPNLCTLE